MKFGYRDRIILMIGLVLVVFGIGIFVFIKPKWEKLNTAKQSLKDAEEAWNQQLAEFGRIPGKQDNIKKRYQSGLEVSKNFTDEMTSVELDEFLRENFFNIEPYIEDKVLLQESFTVTEEGTQTMAYYYYTPAIVTYPLYEAADLDGSLAEAAAEKRHDATVLSSRSAQTVGVGKSSITVRINREDTMTLIDSVSDYAKKHSDAMRLTSVHFEEFDFNENIEEAEVTYETVVDDEGNETQVPVATPDADVKEGVIPGYTNVTFEYEVYYMQEPTEPEVGPAYNESVWDGEDWRTARAQ